MSIEYTSGTAPDAHKSDPRIGVGKGPGRIKVRGYWHFTECAVAMWPKMFPDEDCICLDWSP